MNESGTTPAIDPDCTMLVTLILKHHPGLTLDDVQ